MELSARAADLGQRAAPDLDLGRKEVVAAPAGDRGLLGFAVVPPETDYPVPASPCARGAGRETSASSSASANPRKTWTIRYQSIELIIHPDGSATLERRKTRVTFPQPGASLGLQDRGLGISAVRPARRGDAGDRSPRPAPAVRWGGDEMPSLCQAAVNKLFTQEDYAGAVGVSCIDNMAIFRNPELMILER